MYDIMMSTLIFKTNIETDKDFLRIKSILSEKKKIEECTIDLDDTDRVMRILSDSLTITEVENELSALGYYCKELED
jgi:hypothetical protein